MKKAALYINGFAFTIAGFIYVLLLRPLSYRYFFNKYWYKKQLPPDEFYLNNRYCLYLHYIKKGYKNLLSPHPLFNSRYYCKKYGHEFKTNTNPLFHFIQHGGSTLYNPCPLFDTAFYTTNYAVENKMNPVVHFIQTGAELGYAPNKFFLEAREIEPTISYSFFGQKGERHHYIILDKNKNTVAFQEIYTKHVKSRPDYLYVVNSEELDRLMEFIDIHKELYHATNKQILIIVLNKPAYRPKSTNDNNISCVYLEDLSVRLNKKRKDLLLIRLIVQLKPAVVHFYDSSSFMTLMKRYQKQLSQITRISLTLSEKNNKILFADSIILSADNIFIPSWCFSQTYLSGDLRERIILYPDSKNSEKVNSFRNQLMNRYFIQ